MIELKDTLPQGIEVDPDELAAVKIALKGVVNGFSYAGISVGSYVTDAEITQAAIAALTASINFRKGQEI